MKILNVTDAVWKTVVVCLVILLAVTVSEVLKLNKEMATQRILNKAILVGLGEVQ